jgi:hypothetical protein
MPNKKENLPYSGTCTTKTAESKLLFSAVTLSERMELHAHHEVSPINHKIAHKTRR